MIAIGIDPANSGAAVILKNNEMLAVFCWANRVRKKKKYYKIKYFQNFLNIYREFDVDRPSDIGEKISKVASTFVRDDEEVLIGIEDVYFAKNVKTSISITKLSAALVAPLELKFRMSPAWVLANEWRSVVLKCKRNTKREQAKELSLRYIPDMVKNLDKAINKIGKLDHITDAAGIAVWLTKEKEYNGQNH